MLQALGETTTNVFGEWIQTLNSAELKPIVSAEWNYNLFQKPYITTAGDGSSISKTLSYGSVYESFPPKEGFDSSTKYFSVSGTSSYVQYAVSGLSGLSGYKVVTYVKTNSSSPITVSATLKSGTNGVYASSDVYGSDSKEVNSYSWTKMEISVGANTVISSLIFKLMASTLNEESLNFNVIFTEPEFYKTTNFDHINGSIWSTDYPFTYFRPGESYVETGNANINLPDNFRRIAKNIRAGDTQSYDGFYGERYMPCSPIVSLPRIATFKNKIDPLIKHPMISDMSPYKYFVSDLDTKVISAKWKPNILTNKIVLKFQSTVSTPTVNISITNAGGSTTVISSKTPNEKGLLVLYWNGVIWTESKWSTMPKFNKDTGAFLNYAEISKITVEQISSVINSVTNSDFSALTLTDDQTKELKRMHVIEISPRLEIDLTDFVQGFSINKTLDNGNTQAPISSIESNDALVTLSAIPARTASNSPVPIFSNESNLPQTVLSGMLRKNVKFYISFNATNVSFPNYIREIDEYIHGGVFYSEFWQEQDVDSVSVQLLDVTKYLQNMPVPDYVAQYTNSFAVITDILDFAGFTDYDYDSLYTACYNNNTKIDLGHYFSNSKDKTVFDALKELLLAYQIGAYIDEYGVMRFLSLSEILSANADFNMTDFDILENGFSLTTSQKPGKVIIRYNPPIIKQSPSIENITNKKIFESPSFILTTSNDVVWSQQSADSVGFNYLSASMSETDTEFYMEPNSNLLDIFKTYSVDQDGYAIIEGEIVTFVYKKYSLSAPGVTTEIVHVANNLELRGKINDFIKKNNQSVSSVTVTPEGYITNVRRGMFGTGIKAHNVLTSGISEKSLLEASLSNTSNTITTGTSNTFPTNSRIGIIAK